MAVRESSSLFTTVLLSSEIATIIAAFQNGGYRDLITLVPIYKSHYEPSFIRSRMQLTHSLLETWFHTYGVARLPKFLAFSTKFRLVMVQYAVYFGRMDLVAVLHPAVELCLFHEPLVDLAALNGHTEMTKYLQRIGHPGESTAGIEWAAQNGHLTTLESLMEQISVNEATRTSAIKLASRAGHTTIVQFLQNSLDQPKASDSLKDKTSLAESNLCDSSGTI
ncbi:hypothetical protein AC1031_020015 [Aphanomyces cochlioides]|nr:hypothetical protein AC1031_020015 [Aphanomyces cochlioides]